MMLMLMMMMMIWQFVICVCRDGYENLSWKLVCNSIVCLPACLPQACLCWYLSLFRSSGEASVLAPGWGQMRHNHPVPKPAITEVVDSGMKFPWEKGADEWNSREEFSAEKKARVKPPTMAELTIPEDELKRLRNLGLLVRRRLKIGRLGVTPGIVDAIHEGWRTEEIIKVKCDGPPALNMKKTHEDLEVKRKCCFMHPLTLFFLACWV